jgi:hypothetical protein
MQFGQAVQEASSTESGSDFKEVVHQVRTAIEADDLPAVEAILEQHEWKFDAVKLNSLGDSQLVGFLEYHKMLGGLNTRLGEWGGVSEASDAVEYLERAQQASYLLEDRLGGSNRGLEIPDLYRLNREISTMLDLARALGDISDLPGSSHPLIPESVDYIGDDVRIAIGYDSETDLTGDFFWNVFENADSAVSFEGWKGNESSGGLKLNYHWLGGERKSGKDIYGETIYLDGRVRKLFLATDWNVYGDGKLTLGGGGERQDRFWSAYASKSITGERLLYSDSSSIGNETSGITIDLHPWRQTDTLTTTTEHLAHPYDWGVGFRFGQFVNSSLLRLRGGLDYEFGDYASSQLTASVNLEKRFLGRNYGLSLRIEALRKRGDFETDRSDVRISLLWSWDFGTIFRYVGTAPEDCPIELDARVEAAWIRRALRNSVGYKRTVDYYRYDRVSEQFDTTYELLNEGPLAVDDSYEEDEAYTVERDSTANVLPVLKNDSDPENDTLNIVSFTQPRNGTVEMEGNYLLYSPRPGYTGEDSFTYTIEDLYTTTPHDPGPNSMATVTINVKKNDPPVAVNDNYEVMKNTHENPFPVMQNDYDPNGDPISIIADSVTSPTERGGAAVVTGATISYSPATGFCGVDRFSYAVEDDQGARSNTATVTVTVTNTPPVAVDDSAATYVNSPIVIPVLANDHDPDGDPIEITEIGPASRRGTVVDNGNGTVTYTPYRGWWGVDTFRYTIVDDCGDTATAMVTVEISPDIPPVVSPMPGN